MELEREEISMKFDEANQTIGVLRFENNFLAEKTKKLEAKLFQVRAQMERTLSAKLDKMLSLQKYASDRTGLGYNFSSPSIASTSITVYVSPTNNVESKNNDVKMCQLVTTQIRVNLSQEHSLSQIRKRLKTLGLRREILKSLNRRSNISVITVE